VGYEHLFDAQLEYRTDFGPVVPAEGREGKLLGSGDGRADGPRIRGTVRFSFYEEGCPLDPGFLEAPADATLAEGDYLCKTNPGGVIETDDGATIQFDAKGFALRLEGPGPDVEGGLGHPVRHGPPGLPVTERPARRVRGGVQRADRPGEVASGGCPGRPGPERRRLAARERVGVTRWRRHIS
jgi:hypothetical protein